MAKKDKAYYQKEGETYQVREATADLLKESFDKAFEHLREAQAEGSHFILFVVDKNRDGFQMSGNVTAPEMVKISKILDNEALKIGLMDLFGLSPEDLFGKRDK
jgi:hypothetical protein